MSLNVIRIEKIDEDFSSFWYSLSEKEALVVELEKQTSQLASDLEKVSQDLQAQRDKNNELRAKNTKLMDTLSVTEKNLEARITQSELLVQVSGKGTWNFYRNWVCAQEY